MRMQVCMVGDLHDWRERRCVTFNLVRMLLLLLLA